MNVRAVSVFAGVVLLAGCATNFSAPGVRSEITRQTGATPTDAFEFQAGALTMALANKFLSVPAETPMSDSRVTSFEVAVYELARTERTVDFTAMPVRGWQPALRVRDEHGSGMVLMRMNGDAIADLVVLVSDTDGALYGRVSGALSKELQQSIVKAVQSGGTAGVRRQLRAITP